MRQNASTLSFALAVLSIGCCGTVLAQQGSVNSGADAPEARAEAMQMVRADAQLQQTLTADKMQPGSNFMLRLDRKTKLANGTELPAGTNLIGTVAADDLNVDGNSKFAVRISEARLKNGESMPIKATIVGAFQMENADEAQPRVAGEDVPNTWNSHTTTVVQRNVVSGVDLHSRVDSQNSGTFVTAKNNVKIAQGTEIELAIAPMMADAGGSAQ